MGSGTLSICALNMGLPITSITTHTSLDEVDHSSICVSKNKHIGTSTEDIMHRGYGERTIGYERTHSMNNRVTINNTDNTTILNDATSHVMPIRYADNNGTPTLYDQSDLDTLFVSAISIDYNTNWLFTCIDGEQVTLPINGEYTTVRYSWIWIMLVRAMKGYNTSTTFRSGNTGYGLIVNRVLTNKHTDGIVHDNAAHGNQVPRSFIISGNASATGYVLSFRNDNARELLVRKDNHDDNTRDDCNTAQLIVEFENVSLYNISPTRWDGRGVSTDRFKVQSEYASNLDELERYL